MSAAPRRSASHGEAGYARRPGDAYFTEEWVTRALLAAVEFAPSGKARGDTVIWEPACGDGRMARPLEAAGYRVIASDIEDYGYGRTGFDFLGDIATGELLARRAAIDAIVTNPPFDRAAAFIRQALKLTEERQGSVAILQRHEFDAPASNRSLFLPPFAAKLVLHKRPRWIDGPDAASPRFPYAWYLWDWRHAGMPVIRWLADPDKPGETVGRLL